MYLVEPDSLSLARIIHECRREAFETETRRGFLQARSTQAYMRNDRGGTA